MCGKSKTNTLKKKYDVFTALKSNSGFGWDAENQVPTAPIDVWERYLSANPKAREFRKKTLKHYAELEELFLGVRATGEYAITPSTIFDLKPIPASSIQPSKSEPHSQPGSYVETPLAADPVPMSQIIKEKPSLKKVKWERISSGKAIAQALLEIKDTAQVLCMSKTEHAVAILQKEYEDTMEMDDLIQAINLFENIRKVEIFITMNPGKLRDAWLEKELKK
ncbi:hypothetical protein P167DRAFT_574475 [Morchella conica CCBAS932]|uniref:Myb/SANT-like domain-containing protein n=1 Tax=Morchella conica CCBAS932 TaxID=1392247 RepID=A0A3N4KVN9_9PEZI|nr:hypothetical protein P167DRAFT_574475 [Morchella conica CCBAS932]